MATTSKISPSNVIKEVCASVTSKLIEQMKNGALPWSSGLIRAARPVNESTGNFYSGINWILLSAQAQHETPCWMTYKQAVEKGYQVRAGERSQTIFLYQPMYFDPVTERKISPKELDAMTDQERKSLTMVPFMKYANVFNLDQMDNTSGAIENYKATNVSAKLNCEAVVSSWKKSPKILTVNESVGGSYDQKSDAISMPHRWQYDSTGRYYKALFHELVHSTGHSDRINRRSFIQIEDNLPFEEMVAEIGAAFLCNLTGITDDNLFDSSAAYVQHWIKSMENDERYFFRAAAAAQKAVDHIMADFNSMLIS